MADRITQQDIDKVFHLLIHTPEVGGLRRVDKHTQVTRDNWRILIGGWHHHVTDEQGARNRWSRGFTIADAETKAGGRGYIPTVDDEGDYGGKGWHLRMARRILRDLVYLRGQNREPKTRSQRMGGR